MRTLATHLIGAILAIIGACIAIALFVAAAELSSYEMAWGITIVLGLLWAIERRDA